MEDSPSRPRAPWPGEGYAAIAGRVGRAFYRLLLSEARWIHRRGETIGLLTHQFARRSISVDFTVPEHLRDRIKLPHAGEWLVPLGLLRKEPLRNFDLRDETRAAVPLLERAGNGPLAHHVLLTAARLALQREGIHEVSEGLVEHLRVVATRPDDEAEAAIGQMLVVAEREERQYQAFLANDRCRFLLGALAENFLVVAQLADVGRRRILKYSRDEELGRPRASTVLELLGWRAFGVEVEVPDASHGPSYHAEVEIPEELRINGSAIVDEDTFAVYARDGEADRAALYASGVPLAASPVLFAAIRAERGGFPAIAAAVAWVTAVILGAGAFLGDLASASAGPAISVLLAGSALFTGAVARTGEHRLVQARFLIPRLLLGLSALCALVAGAALVFDFCALATVWDFCAGIALGVAAILSVTLLRAATTTPLRRQ